MSEQKTTRFVGSKTGKLEGETIVFPLGQGIAKDDNIRYQLTNYNLDVKIINGKPYVVGKRK